ncbi:MAG: Ig-like domain-containing protein [Lachnospiraceae bacterium]|nr:Ig-like domain-containing protein [Lachnospiraceae bacterium]
MKIKRTIMVIIALALVVGTIYTVPPTRVSAAKRVKISAESLYINPGAVRTLTVSGASGRVNWSTSNSKVVSIKKNGNKATITAKKKGNATITAKVGKTKLQCKVKVSGKKVLIAYFSRSGNSKKVAKYIQKQIGGDMVQIKTKMAYPSNYGKCAQQAQKELEDDIRPKITTKVKNFDKYDEVVIGYPIWWGMAPRAVCTFVEQYNWEGKTLITYCTSSSSGVGGSAAEIRKLCKGAKRTKAFSAYDGEILNSNLKKKINKWLKNIKA